MKFTCWQSHHWFLSMYGDILCKSLKPCSGQKQEVRKPLLFFLRSSSFLFLLRVSEMPPLRILCSWRQPRQQWHPEHFPWDKLKYFVGKRHLFVLSMKQDILFHLNSTMEEPNLADVLTCFSCCDGFEFRYAVHVYHGLSNDEEMKVILIMYQNL